MHAQYLVNVQYFDAAAGVEAENNSVLLQLFQKDQTGKWTCKIKDNFLLFA